MRRLGLMMFLIAALITCMRKPRHTIEGQLSYEGKHKPDSVYVGLYPLNLRLDLGQPLRFLRQTRSAFAMDVSPGMYTLVVFSYTHETYKTHVYVTDADTRIRMRIHLPRLGLADSIQSVAVTGEWAHWRHAAAQPLEPTNGQWILDYPDSLTQGDLYALLVNGRLFWNLKDPKGKVVAQEPAFRSAYQGGEIVFDPAMYRESYQCPEAQVKGIPNPDQFVDLSHILEDFTGHMYALRRDMNVYGRETIRRQYQVLLSDLQTIQETYDPRFAQIFLEKRIQITETMHPARYEQVRLLQSEADSLAWNAYFVGELFDDYLGQLVMQVRRLNPKSIFLTGRFEDAVWVLWQYFRTMPSNYHKFNLPDRYFESLIVKFIDESSSPLCREYLLFKLVHRYIALNMNPKAHQTLLMMQATHPDNRYMNPDYMKHLLRQTSGGDR